MKKISLFIVALILFGTVRTARAQAGIYVEFVATPTNGFSAPTGEFKLTSVQYQFENPTTIGSTSSGAGAGKVQFNPLVFTKQLDASSPSLQKAVQSGARYETIRVKFYSATHQLVYQVSFGTAFVSSYATSAAEACANGCPGLNESISIVYGQITTADYTQSPVKVTGWDVVRNVAVNSELP